MICSLEDPSEETNLRLTAMCMQHCLTAGSVDRMVFVFHGDERRMMIASRDLDGVAIVTPDVEPMITYILELGIAAVIVDPFINCHSVNENDNVEINEVMLA